MATAAALANLLSIEADINYYTQQQMFWANKYEANAAKLTKQTNYETNWTKAFDNAMDESRSTDLKMGNTVFIAKNTAAANEAIAEQWANYKEAHYDAQLKNELAELDVQYDSMKCMYETMLEQARSQKEAAQQLAQNNAQDNHTLGN